MLIIFRHKVEILDVDLIAKQRKAKQRRLNSRMAKVREQERLNRAAAESKNLQELLKFRNSIFIVLSFHTLDSQFQRKAFKLNFRFIEIFNKSLYKQIICAGRPRRPVLPVTAQRPPAKALRSRSIFVTQSFCRNVWIIFNVESLLFGAMFHKHQTTLSIRAAFEFHFWSSLNIFNTPTGRARPRSSSNHAGTHINARIPQQSTFHNIYPVFWIFTQHFKTVDIFSKLSTTCFRTSKS